MNDADPELDRVKRKFAADPSFRRKLVQFIRGYDPPETLVDYLDRTLKSPRARALFEEARANERNRPTAQNAKRA